MERIRVLRLLAAAVSDAGTAPMISAGIAPYAKPMPGADDDRDEHQACQAAPIRHDAEAVADRDDQRAEHQGDLRAAGLGEPAPRPAQ